MAAKNADPLADGVNPSSWEAGTQDWVNTCGVCHVGGGQLEYDRDQQPYDQVDPNVNQGDYYVFSYPSLSDPNPSGVAPGPMTQAGNKAEMDCLMCHMASAGNGRAFLQSLGCGPTNPVGPANDADCDGATDPGYPSSVMTAGAYAPGTAYDMFNRNLGVKNWRLDLAASLGLGATATWNTDGTMGGVSGMPTEIAGSDIVGTPNSSNCAVCHARDDNTPGLTGMMAMKYGFGNYALMFGPGQALDTDNGPGAANEVFWYDLGCKTGMGKRTHKVGQTGDDFGPNGRYGMSMFMASTRDGDPTTVPNMGDPIDSKMPDIDVHDRGGMQCATCHNAIGSRDLEGGSKTFPAGEHHGVAYPAETVYGYDHQFAQGDSYPDTKSKNNLDGTVSCESCHITMDHPRVVAGELNPPVPTHAAFPQLHLDKIACSTCHIPEVYGAPGRLKYRDWTAGFYKGTFRNMLDWNFDLVTGSHKPMPVVHKWLHKFGETKIYPVLPSVMPIWVQAIGNSGQELGSADGTTDMVDFEGVSYPTDPTLAAPVKARDTLAAAEAVRDIAGNPYDIRINGGNVVPLFDGFSLADSWEIDKKAEIDAMIASFANNVGITVPKLKLFQADFDVTHGIVPAEWALGGSARGGCVSCHSSADPADPNYSPNSVAFFEGKIQPLDNAGMGIGGYDPIKNWFALFADYDCTAMCDWDYGPDGLPMTADDGSYGMDDSRLFDPLSGAPNLSATCNMPSLGMSTLGDCITMMTSTFDQVMGFPAGTAQMMGMYDGVAGLQGFTIREPVQGGTQGCNPFAGPAYRSPMPGQSVNNCVPAGAPFDGTCVGADPVAGTPGGCSGGFRNGGDCMTDVDCQGAMTDPVELAKNPNGLMYSRAEVRSHFKIDLQQSITGTGMMRVTWPVGGEKNPANPAHVNKWDQAMYCWDYSGGNPMAPGVKPCADGESIANVIPANAFLGYTDTMLAALKTPQSSPYFASLDAKFTYTDDAADPMTKHFDASASQCPDADCRYDWDFGDGTTASATDTTPVSHTYAASGTYTASLTVTDVNAIGEESPGYSDTASRDVTIENLAPPATTIDFVLTGADLEVNVTKGANDEEIIRVIALWGDGQRDIIRPFTGAPLTHTYAANGSYLVRVYVYHANYAKTYETFTAVVSGL